MNHLIQPSNKTSWPTRRCFLASASATTFSFALPAISKARMSGINDPIKLGLIADLHQDIMHDGLERTSVFVKEMEKQKPNAIMQLGDFAYPSEKNKKVIDLFNQAHRQSLHVIGNHDTDSGHTIKQCLERWGMPGRFYAHDLNWLRLLVLDGNDKGSPTHRGGYASFIGKQQLKWLQEQLAGLDGLAMIVSHQPLAGASAVDNASELQALLSKFSDKILIAINGHTHVDDVLRIGKVTYMHVNSASYKWVGGNFKNKSYDPDVHSEYPWIEYTCPYKDSVFATMMVDPTHHSISIEGRKSEWVGKSPAELGSGHPTLTDGEEIAPRIRNRKIKRVIQKTQ